MIFDLSLMKIQVGTLFVHDDEERLRFINEPYRPEDHPAPVVFIGRTRCGSVVRFRYGELMRINLKKASMRDAEAIHRLQVESFLPLLRKYRDCETNPANEDVERVIDRLKQLHTTYYFIVLDGVRIGAIRIIYDGKARRARISPMFIVPEHQGKGYGQDAMALVEDVVDAERWELETILQEEGNCYFYE